MFIYMLLAENNRLHTEGKHKITVSIDNQCKFPTNNIKFFEVHFQ